MLNLDELIKELESEKQYELYGMYDSYSERMIAEEKMWTRNEVVDDCIEIVKRWFGGTR